MNPFEEIARKTWNEIFDAPVFDDERAIARLARLAQATMEATFAHVEEHAGTSFHFEGLTKDCQSDILRRTEEKLKNDS